MWRSEAAEAREAADKAAAVKYFSASADEKRKSDEWREALESRHPAWRSTKLMYWQWRLLRLMESPGVQTIIIILAVIEAIVFGVFTSSLLFFTSEAVFNIVDSPFDRSAP